MDWGVGVPEITLDHRIAQEWSVLGVETVQFPATGHQKNSRNFLGHQQMGKKNKETGTLRETLIVRLVQILPQGNPCMEYRCGILILVWHVNVLFEIYHCML